MPQKRNFAPSAIPLTLLFAAMAVPFASRAAAQPQNCPPEGTATTQREKDLNILKNRDDAPPASEIDPNATLSAVLAPGADLDRWSTDKGAIFEGIVLKVKPGESETPNCGAKDAAHQDTHIELALDPGAPSTQRVIVEVTPRWRQKIAVIQDWSTKTLHDRLLGRRVRVTGWLLADFIHKGQAENTHPGGKKNWRASIWEIHPITWIEVLPGAAAALVAAPAPSPARAHHRSTSRKRCLSTASHKCRTRAHRKHATTR